MELHAESVPVAQKISENWLRLFQVTSEDNSIISLGL